MRNPAARKLKSDRGASLLITLVFFLLSVVVGTVLLTAAAGNLGKSRANQTAAQQYLTIKSAARLVQDRLSGTALSAGETVRQVTNSPGAVGAPYTVGTTAYSVTGGGELNGLVEELFRAGYGAIDPATGVRQPPLGDPEAAAELSGEGLEAVRVALTLDRDTFVLTARFTLTDQEGVPLPDHAMTLTLAPAPAPVTRSWDEVDRVYHYTTVTPEDGSDPYEELDYVTITTTTTYETAAVWDEGTLTKGVTP